MASIKQFEDMEIWQKARVQAKDCFRLAKMAHKQQDFELANALPKTSGSVMGNVAEGFGRGGNKEFAQFLSIAYASSTELKSQLYRFCDRPYHSENVEGLLSNYESLKNQINAFMMYLKKSDLKGYKFKDNK